MEQYENIIPVDCDGCSDKPELPGGYDASETAEFQAVMAQDVPGLDQVFDQMVELAKQRGDLDLPAGAPDA